MGPGTSKALKGGSRGMRSLRKAVEREAGKCSRGFSRMNTIIKRTEELISEENESISNQKRIAELKK